ncbi:MAG: hypothetical protein AVDCRST_MAG66-127, partial [uncultured Pseudonocardia sp.]
DPVRTGGAAGTPTPCGPGRGRASAAAGPARRRRPPPCSTPSAPPPTARRRGRPSCSRRAVSWGWRSAPWPARWASPGTRPTPGCAGR